MVTTPVHTTRLDQLIDDGNYANFIAPVADTVTFNDGTTLTVWAHSATGSGGEILGQFRNADGSPRGGQFTVNSLNDGTQFDPHATLLTGGQVAIVWDTLPGDGHHWIKGRVLNEDGSPSGKTEFRVNNNSDHDLNYDSSIAPLPDGGFVVSWTRKFQNINTTYEDARRFYSDGNPIDGDDLQINTAPRQESNVTVRPDGTFIIGSEDYVNNNVSAYFGNNPNNDTSVQFNLPSNGPQHAPDVANIGENMLMIWNMSGFVGSRSYSQQTGIGLQYGISGPIANVPPVVTGLTGGLFAVAWVDLTSNAIVTELVAPDGRPIGSPTSVGAGVDTNHPHNRLSISPTADNGYVITYDAQDTNSGGYNVRTTTVAADANAFLGRNSDDQLTAGFTTHAAVMFGYGGNDTLTAPFGGRLSYLYGGDGDDVLVARVSAQGSADGTIGDVLDGGNGIDTARINLSGTSVPVSININVPQTQTFGSGTLTSIEKLDFQGGSSANTITGGSLDDRIIGNVNNDKLSGGSGADLLGSGSGGTDTLTGGPGNDTYDVKNTTATIVENANEGTDTVLLTLPAGSTYLLPANVEQLSIQGAGAISATGNDLANHMVGNAGNDLLDGGRAADTMEGGLGNDIYVVDDPGDRVIEKAGEGTDEVISSISYLLPANVESLRLAGNANLSGKGNALVNGLIGNDGNNLLDGQAGADLMSGNGGNDTYIVDDPGDRVVEGAGGGDDIVKTSLSSYALPANVEKVIYTSGAPANVQITGNAEANEISGGAGADILDGQAGADVLEGGAGNDTYLVDNAGDKIIESAGSAGGHDTERATATTTLGANVEALVLTGTHSISGTGNALANTLTGNSGANYLDGGLGNDLLKGSSGNDSFLFKTALGPTNVDHIVDFSVHHDHIRLDDAVFKHLRPGALSESAFKDITHTAEDADDRILYNHTTGRLYYDPDGSGAASKITVAILDHHPSLSFHDILVV